MTVIGDQEDIRDLTREIAGAIADGCGDDEITAGVIVANLPAWLRQAGWVAPDDRQAVADGIRGWAGRLRRTGGRLGGRDFPAALNSWLVELAEITRRL